MQIEITNMCMILDPATKRIVVQKRVKYWTGLAFPGGHLERGESLVESAIREVREETGLIVSDLKPCGIIPGPGPMQTNIILYICIGRKPSTEIFWTKRKKAPFSGCRWNSLFLSRKKLFVHISGIICRCF